MSKSAEVAVKRQYANTVKQLWELFYAARKHTKPGDRAGLLQITLARENALLSANRRFRLDLAAARVQPAPGAGKPQPIFHIGRD